MKKKGCQKKAQTLVEYSLVIGIIVMAVVTMGPLVKRGIQGMVKVVADQVGNQQNADQTFDDTGFLNASDTIARSLIEKTTTDRMGVITYIYNDQVVTQTNMQLDLGFSPQSQ